MISALTTDPRPVSWASSAAARQMSRNPDFMKSTFLSIPPHAAGGLGQTHPTKFDSGLRPNRESSSVRSNLFSLPSPQDVVKILPRIIAALHRLLPCGLQR